MKREIILTGTWRRKDVHCGVSNRGCVYVSQLFVYSSYEGIEKLAAHQMSTGITETGLFVRRLCGTDGLAVALLFTDVFRRDMRSALLCCGNNHMLMES